MTVTSPKLSLTACKGCGGPKEYEPEHRRVWTGLCVTCQTEGLPVREPCPGCSKPFRALRAFGCYCSKSCALNYDPRGVLIAEEVMRGYRKPPKPKKPEPVKTVEPYLQFS